MIKSMRWTTYSSLLLVFAPLIAVAGSSDDVHRLLIAERFVEADAHAQAALTSAQGTDKAAILKRLAALNLLLDSARAHYRLMDDDVAIWIDQDLTLTRALYGDNARALAKPLAVAAARQRQLRFLGRNKVPAPNTTGGGSGIELVGKGVDLVEHGTGELKVADRAYVYQISAQYAADNGHFDQALAAIQHANALLLHAHTDWEQWSYATTLSLLGWYQQKTGNDVAGLASARAGADLAVHVSGKQSLLDAETLTYLGQNLFFNGDYLGAKAILKNALAIERSHFSGKDNGAVNFGFTLTTLANAMLQLGEYDGARPLYEEAIGLADSDNPENYGSALPTRLNSLALLEKDVGNFQRARVLFDRALTIAELQNGPTHSSLMPILTNLGNLTMQQDEIDAAEGYFHRSLNIVVAAGNLGASGSLARQGLAEVALARAQPAVAEELLAESSAQLTENYGNQHPDLFTMQCDQGLAKARLGKYDEAFDIVKGSERLRVDLLRRIAPVLSESQSLNFKRRLGNCAGLLVALAERTHDSNHALNAWQLVAAARGLTTRIQMVRLTMARNAADAAGKQRWAQWERAAHAYADLLLQSKANSDALKIAHNALDHAEADLGEPTLAAAGIGQGDLTLDATFAKPPEGDVMAAYAQVDHVELDSQAHNWRPHGHVTYVLVREGDETRLLTLGDSAVIDDKIERWHALLRNPGSDLVQLATTGHAVRAAIWDPLAIRHRATQVFIVPDGALFRINFAALPDGDGFLVERGWRVHLFDSERDLITDADGGLPQNLLLVGSPDFGPLAAPTTGARRALCDTGFIPLPGTKIEMDRLALLWQGVFDKAPIILSGRAANKTALRAASANSSIIHIATHALDLDDACDHSAAARGVGLSTTTKSAHTTTPSAALALAGANDYLTKQNVGGILTSEEVITLPLDHTQWVVLSACDTGLGEVVNGEGVFGLRRAFRLAGARTVVMSLWKVDDGATADWMEALYRARLLQHASTPEAIAQAQLSMLSTRRARGESTHPFYWAAFIASGDWR